MKDDISDESDFFGNPYFLTAYHEGQKIGSRYAVLLEVYAAVYADLGENGVHKVRKFIPRFGGDAYDDEFLLSLGIGL